MCTVRIQPFKHIVPMIYAYTTPEIERHNGWTKIGYTVRNVRDRIAEQTHTADVQYKLEWQSNAMYDDGSGEYFKDKDFHAFLTHRKHVMQEEDKNNEWFHIAPLPAHEYLNEFKSRTYSLDADEGQDYTLRPEQEDAVVDTLSYFDGGGAEFLWNAKPRFGKTLTSYDLVRRMAAQLNRPIKVLVVTNRPSIANSWAEDFNKFVGWRKDMCFVSSNDALKNVPYVHTREEYNQLGHQTNTGLNPGMVAFESLQGLKGSIYFGGHHDKLKWISELEFDLLIVDESQEGVDTLRTDRAFANIKRKHTLYLSGTPFKALADGRFSESQIYNWSYEDEQRAKRNWSGLDYNAYEDLPELQMYTYRMSAMVESEARAGAVISENGENVDYAFDLNEFFTTVSSGNGIKFAHEQEVCHFLDALTTQERYPFSTPELRQELSHTLWLLNRVASAKALAKLLKEHPVFKDYEIIVAAGDGAIGADDDSVTVDSYNRVKNAIAEHDKTITLSVGQLTVGVTVPEWSGVLMLSNMKSPSAYMQAAFRVQNPCEMTVIHNGLPMRVRKERAYVFDFDPARTLVIYDEFANNLSTRTSSSRGTSDERRKNIRELLNFFPVIGEDEHGRMELIDAQQVLSIPRMIKSREVVRHGFISNYLFSDISCVFGAPTSVSDILQHLTPANPKEFDANHNSLQNMNEIPVNDQGDISVPDEIIIGKTADIFGPKIYNELTTHLNDAIDEVQNTNEKNAESTIEHLGAVLKTVIESQVIAPASTAYGIKKSTQNALIRDSKKKIDKQIYDINATLSQKRRIADTEYQHQIMEADTDYAINEAKRTYEEKIQIATKEAASRVEEITKDLINTQPRELVRHIETIKAEEEKHNVENNARALLRGFARTIPSFIMAYGDENLTLANFDEYTEDEVFEEVTGISEEDFRFLRDGGERNGEHFAGHLFDETVFNDSIQEFLNKKRELANYFDEARTEDIFDYIPPQKTNQIFTPRWVVKHMVDDLERENPGCFDNPYATFADLYMKSGLYITEIVKRLFKSDKLKQIYPNDSERIRHILHNQVYGMAPTRIIYLIAVNYILGFDNSMQRENCNFVQADAAAAAKAGKLPQLVDEAFTRGNTGEPQSQPTDTSDNGTSSTHNKESDWLIDELRAAKIEYIDKRPRGGSLWVLGGESLKGIMAKLAEQGATFKYKPEGGRATRGRRGWWLR
ncbi:DEAD/DEAH box helicase family protein [Bifidobacterium pseudolongum]|uniref:DEAD/DEAH box helicase family protein n=1 Tax=Bifidobacterium pseudolongum TaxID=1694 RepID=UPI001F562EFC|nr:DEAD/DEAH box helicase family protein [Bifidobacterium pseudolongum]